MTDLTTALSLSDDTWYSLFNSGNTDIHYKQVLTTDANPAYGNADTNFRHTIKPGDKSDFFQQESGVKLWVWCDSGVGLLTLSEAQ